ncbi:MAG: hypothetical protein GX416_10600 [Bacteroidales bacterium]|nr:hypothetical protein [Bacteroidales bacterium]
MKTLKKINNNNNDDDKYKASWGSRSRRQTYNPQRDRTDSDSLLRYTCEP